jgi:hypothetical protein
LQRVGQDVGRAWPGADKNRSCTRALWSEMEHHFGIAIASCERAIAKMSDCFTLAEIARLLQFSERKLRRIIRERAIPVLADGHVFVTIFGIVALTAGRGWVGYAEKPAGQCDIAGAIGIGEEAVVSNAVETVGQHVDQKAADELVDIGESPSRSSVSSSTR